MKIKQDYPKYAFKNVKEAVECSLEPSAYSYSGELERLADIGKKQSEFIANLTQMLFEDNKLSVKQLERLLDYGYTIEE